MAEEPHSPAVARPASDDVLTWVDLVFYAGRIERWIRFGCAVQETILDRRRRRLAFAPGAAFAYVRWHANDRGTVGSRLTIVQAVGAGETLSTVPGVDPGGALLLRLAGWPRVQRALAAIDAVEQAGIEPTAVAPDYWRHLHNRLSARRDPEAYTPARHRAWRLRAELTL